MAHNHVMAIIGGGACGTMFLHDYLCQLENNQAQIGAKPPRIIWIDKQGRFGHADAFDPQQPDCLTMNGPTYMLKPSLAKPGLFHEFYQRATGSKDQEGFIPRNIYGRFMQELVPQLHQRAQALGVTIETVHGAVKSVSEAPGGGLLIKGDHAPLRVDNIALAPGPAYNHAQDHLQGLSGYIALPSRQESFEESGIDFSNPKTRIACFGPGPSCFDGMALLEKEYGFKGTYILVGQPNLPFWTINRSKPVPPDVFYHAQFLVPDKLPCPVTATQLTTALLQDLNALDDKKTNPHELGPEYPLFLAASCGQMLYDQWAKIHDPDILAAAQGKLAFEALQNKAIKMLEVSVSPQMLALYQDLKEQGRIMHVRGRIQEEKITKPDHLFNIPVIRSDDKLQLNYRADAFMNSKPYARGWTPGANSPQESLLYVMERQGLVRKQPGSHLGLYDFSHGLQNHVALLGAPTDVMWGVHLASYKNAQAAEHFVRKMLKHGLTDTPAP